MYMLLTCDVVFHFPCDVQVEDMKCQLQATHVAEKNALVAELEAKRASEVNLLAF